MGRFQRSLLGPAGRAVRLAEQQPAHQGLSEDLFTVARNWSHINLRHAVKGIFALMEDVYMYKPVYYLVRKIAMSEIRLWRILDLKFNAMTCSDEKQFAAFIDAQTVPERWALRLNPFLFSNPFEKLFEGLFEFEQELDKE